MAQKIQIRRGLRTDLPTLSEGELAFCTDTKEYFIGSSQGNIKIANYADLGSVIHTGIDYYRTEPVGELFDPPGEYNAWCPTNLQFDKSRKVFVLLINAADSHVFTVCDHYFTEINPDTLVAKTPKKILPVDGIGNPVTYATAAAVTSFTILNDGTYVYFRRSTDTFTYNRVTSTDNGVTWVDQGAIIVNPAFTSAYTIWGIRQFPNGRLIVGLGGHANSKAKILISDDNGANWSVVTIGVSPALTGSITAAEPAIFEVEPNKLIAIARKSTSGLSYGTANGAPDPALIAFSNDGGLTWSQYQESKTIVDMNAASATAVVHDGMVEVFAASRFYTTTSNTNTGQTGALYHFTAKIENALTDNFTLKGVAVYAHAKNSTDFHSPCASVDNKKRLLLCYMDEAKYPQAASVTYPFIRGGLGIVANTRIDGAKSPVLGYSGKHVEDLISDLKTEIASLQNSVSKITSNSNPVQPPKRTLIWTNVYNANLENTIITSDVDFTGKINASSPPTLVTDTTGTYSNFGTTFGIAFQCTKPNFVIQYKGTLNNQLKAPIGGIIAGVGKGIISVDSNFNLKDSNTVIHAFRFEYWNGTMKIFIDGADVTYKLRTFNYDSTDIMPYTQLSSVIGTLDVSKNYAICGVGAGGKVYDVRFGEWD